MKTKLLFALFLLSGTLLFAQKQYVIGNVKNEVQNNVPQTYIYNTRTEELVITDISGDFIISAIPTDELRIVKSGFERISLRVSLENYAKPLQLILSKIPFEIEEVTIAFKPTGNLKKDLAYFKTSAKTEKLNSDLNKYVMTPSTVVAPRLSMPSAFAPPNYNAGQVNLGGIASAIAGLLGKVNNSPPTTATYAETQDFFRRVKTSLDMRFYSTRGFTERDIDAFLIYADDNYALAKKYRKSFDVQAIDLAMKLAYKEFIKTHKLGS